MVTKSKDSVKLKKKNRRPVSRPKPGLASDFYNKNLFLEIFNGIPDELFVKDSEMRYLMVNASAKKFLWSQWGLDEKDIIGKTDMELMPRLPAELAKRFTEKDAEVLLKKESQTFEEKGISDSKKVLLKTKIPYFNDRGDVAGIVGLAHDITSIHDHAERQGFIASVSKLLGESLDLNTTIANFANSVVPKFADWCSIFIVGHDQKLHSIANLHKDKEKNILLENLSVLNERKGAKIGAYNVIRTGIPELYKIITPENVKQAALQEDEIKFMADVGVNSAMFLPIKARHETFGLIVMARDVSQEPYTENDFEMAKEIVYRLAIAVDNAYLHQSLIKADKAKDEFLATLSHELRNPLAPLLNSLQLIHLQSLNNQKLEVPLNVAERQLKNMTRLLDDLLDVSRIMRGNIALKKTTINIRDVINEAVSVVRPTISSKRHNLIVLIPETPVWLFADPLRIEQVVINLLNNAAKYTNAGGTIILTCRENADGIIISVKDNGIGMAPETLKHIFSYGAIVSQSNHAGEGLGIGLKLIKDLVELHGGAIQAMSRGLNKGSEFVVRMPTKSPIAEPEIAKSAAVTEKRAVQEEELRKVNNFVRGQESTPNHEGSEKEVLIVDDNEDAARSLNALVGHLGFNSEMTKSGSEALKIVESQMPKVVLLDIGMPEMDGYEVARRIRSQEGGKNIVLIAITGYGQSEDKKRALEAGFNMHITKPIDVVGLKNVLNLYIRK